MPKLTVLLLSFLLFFFNQFSTAQNISGKISDTANKKYVSNAVVALLTPGDSMLYKFVRTDASGKFEIKNTSPGKYIVLITHPYYANYIDDITVATSNLDLKEIPFISKARLLQEVIVKSGSPIKIKGDTTEYTADSFRVQANANVEELLKKLPGIQVGKDGTIKAMGEKVTKVLVDGEEFFGDDPGIAVKNLRADAVDKVQVFDKKSDQATFTGIDDGVKDKTINLKLKDDKKNGYFGKLSGSGGLPSNYNNTAMINAFKAKRKIAAYGIMSNTGQTNLDWQDQNNYGGGMGDNMVMEDNGDVYFYGGGDGEDNFRGGRNGIPRNWNAGLHFSDKYNNNKISLNTGYKYTKINSLGNTTTFSKIFQPDTSWNNNSTNNTYTSRTKHAFNLTYETMIDSFNTIKYTVKLNKSNTQTSSKYFTEAIDNNGNFINNSNRTSTNIADNNAANGTMLWKHKFKKLFRTLSLNIDFNWNESKNDGFLFSNITYFKDGQLRKDTIDQHNIRDNENTGLTSKLAYTEPLFKDAFMEFSYIYSFNKNANNRISAAKDLTGKYLDEIDSLTNKYKFDRMVNRPGINFRYNKKKMNYAIGSSVAFNRFLQKDISRNRTFSYNFINYFPTAMFQYKMSGNKNFRFNYNGSATAPTLEQLQPIKDNTDPLNIFEGNPNLDQSFRHNLNVSYSFYNVLKEKGFWSNLQYAKTNNAFVQSSTINYSTGERRYKTVNANGVQNLNLYVDYSFKLKGSGLRLSVGPTINNSQNIDFVNNRKNTNKTTSYGMNLGVNKYVDDKYHFSVRPTFSLNRSSSDLNTSANIDYWQLSCWMDGKVTLPGKIDIKSDARLEIRQKDPRFTANNNYTLWNAALSKKFFSNKLEAEFGVNDLLSQNRGFSRNFSSSSFTESYYNTLRRYWMFTVTWNFSSNGAKPSGF